MYKKREKKNQKNNDCGGLSYKTILYSQILKVNIKNHKILCYKCI